MNELEQVKVGDTLINEGASYDPALVLTVERITKTIIICDKGHRFNKKTGRIIGGDDWTVDYVRVPKKGEIEQLQFLNTVMFSVARLHDIISKIKTTGTGRSVYKKITIPQLKLIQDLDKKLRESLFVRNKG
ncbi:MAG: hypothetical protein PVI90_11750 [Desulfobacteraceae bacterium]|jgi:hypothetical protein